MRVDLTRSVVVFDLDDTLYREADYVESGVRHVCRRVYELYGKDAYEDVSEALRSDAKADWISLVCESAGLNDSVKDSLLWMYRLHKPDIQLEGVVLAALREICSVARFAAVLTDGRSITQRQKLEALGLMDLPAYISEDHGDTKPSPNRFRAIERRCAAENYVYVADNVSKDFLGCRPLGWIGIGVRGDERSVHRYSTEGLSEAALPDYWVDDWGQLTSLLLEHRGSTPNL